jgi:hypothetical protein
LTAVLAPVSTSVMPLLGAETTVSFVGVPLLPFPSSNETGAVAVTGPDDGAVAVNCTKTFTSEPALTFPKLHETVLVLQVAAGTDEIRAALVPVGSWTETTVWVAVAVPWFVNFAAARPLLPTATKPGKSEALMHGVPVDGQMLPLAALPRDAKTTSKQAASPSPSRTSAFERALTSTENHPFDRS